MMNPKTLSALALALLHLQAGCTEQQLNSSSDTPNVTSLGLRLPPTIESVRNVNPANVQLELLVGGQQIQNVIKGDQSWQATVNIPPDQATTVSAYWYENFQQAQRLNLAKWEQTITVNTNTTYNISLEDYITTGDEFDADNDLVSNLEERNAHSNPFDPLSTPASIPPVDVIIPVIPDTPAAKPVIDGTYEAAKYEGQNAQFFDTSRQRLYIDNLMLADGSTAGGRVDGNTEMRWFAMHDSTNLYIFVLGENVNTSNPNGDSEDFWNDDNVTIYLDGNNSKSSTYDGVDDVRIEIPLLDSQGNANRSDSATGRILLASALPSGSTTEPPRNIDVEFAACKCGQDEQHTWEIKIPMAQAGLNHRASFGIDVQIDFDHDGDTRDVRWGWFHPSGFDSTWIDPSAMGTAYLQ